MGSTRNEPMRILICYTYPSMRPIVYLACLCCALPCAAMTNVVLRRVADVRDAIDCGQNGIPFDVTVRVSMPCAPNRPVFHAMDESSGEWFDTAPGIRDLCPTNGGDLIRLSGVIIPAATEQQIAEVRQITVISSGVQPEAEPITAKDVFNDNFRNRFVRIDGLVHDAFRDEIDPNWIFLTLNCNDGIVYFAIFTPETTNEELDRLIGARVRVHGTCVKERNNTRKRIGRIVSANSMRAITVLTPSRDDRFDAPSLDELHVSRPSDPTALGRHRAIGHIIAVWHGESLLLKSDTGDIVRIDLAYGEPPNYGERIEAVGFPETDLYRINLSRAVWRPAQPVPFRPEPAQGLTIRQLLVDPQGRSRINAQCHGHVVRLNGLVRSLPGVDSQDGRLYLEDEGFLIPVDASACPAALGGVTIGCTLEVTGTCVTETDNWHSGNVFPRIKEILLVVRTPDDVRILSRPPWWTPQRLLLLVGALLAARIAIGVWNRILRRLVERRGRQLFKAEIARAASELRVTERTRLAVELHDALSQNISSAALQINAAERLSGVNREKELHHLGIAAKTLLSCRQELQNCIWDLRNQALDEPDIGKAIRRMLNVSLGDINPAIRFSVPRRKLDDNTLHTVLKIIRELAVNAVRHGKAKTIRIAGALEDDLIRFSVTDDGIGFDPVHHPGIADGHFGLQGIAERIRQFDGTMDIQSAPGAGTRIAISIRTTP